MSVYDEREPRHDEGGVTPGTNPDVRDPNDPPPATGTQPEQPKSDDPLGQDAKDKAGQDKPPPSNEDQGGTGNPTTPEPGTGDTDPSGDYYDVDREGLVGRLMHENQYDRTTAQRAVNSMLRSGQGLLDFDEEAPQADEVGNIDPEGLVDGNVPQMGDIDPITGRPIDNSAHYLDDVGMDEANTSGIGIGNTDVTTREVTDDELVENRLEGLIAEDSRYIRNARQRAIEEANSRGQFGSSFAAGAAERSAIDAGYQIARDDAQAYRDTAAANMNALNAMAMANLERATQLDIGILNANTSRAMANLDAEVRTSIANLDALTRIDLANQSTKLQSEQTNLAARVDIQKSNQDARVRAAIANLDKDTQVALANLSSQTQVHVQQMVIRNEQYMQNKNLRHDAAMAVYEQQGRIQLADMDASLQLKLAAYERDGQIILADLDHESRMAVQGLVNDHNAEMENEKNALTRQTNHNNLAMQAQMNYQNYLASYAGVDMDASAARRVAESGWNYLTGQLEMINNMFPEFEPIIAQRENMAGHEAPTPAKGKKK